MNRLVSMKHSALMHFIPCELASDPHLAAQRTDDLVIALQALMVTRVFGQPLAEQLVQGSVLSPRARVGGLDQLFISTQRDVLHSMHLSRDREDASSVHDFLAQYAQTALSSSKIAIILLNVASTLASKSDCIL